MTLKEIEHSTDRTAINRALDDVRLEMRQEIEAHERRMNAHRLEELLLNGRLETLAYYDLKGEEPKPGTGRWITPCTK